MLDSLSVFLMIEDQLEKLAKEKKPDGKHAYSEESLNVKREEIKQEI